MSCLPVDFAFCQDFFFSVLACEYTEHDNLTTSTDSHLLLWLLAVALYVQYRGIVLGLLPSGHGVIRDLSVAVDGGAVALIMLGVLSMIVEGDKTCVRCALLLPHKGRSRSD